MSPFERYGSTELRAGQHTGGGRRDRLGRSPSEEWNETRIKSRVLLHADQDLRFVEELRYDPDDPYLVRITASRRTHRPSRISANFFQFNFDSEEVRAQLAQVVADDACKLRLLLSPNGTALASRNNIWGQLDGSDQSRRSASPSACLQSHWFSNRSSSRISSPTPRSGQPMTKHKGVTRPLS